ncbi:OprO/OprP family phosphate-selective porin [Caulobacter sp. RL271]|uniref:OprO/OprP family phosphate-selective porin n=1 Tax=Caulobacter segnis TaxID=88688 RepID=A0ABY4ZTT7_9CAUL|nr:porin [Caulobacter segnis]USQ96034.1 OprO/OprP family phosphate-selective porin [Caulobacter segnis]
MRKLFPITLFAASMMAGMASAQEAPKTDAAAMEELKAQLRVMQERLQSLEAKANAPVPIPIATAPVAKTQAAPATTQIKWENSPRFTEASATFKMRGRLLVDAVDVNVDRETGPSYKSRQYRARQLFLGAEGQVGSWAYRLEGGAANGSGWAWDDAVIEYRMKSGMLLTVGNQKVGGLENLTSIKTITFMERGPFGDLTDNGFVLAAQATKVGRNWSLRGALQGDSINKADVAAGAYNVNNAKERSGVMARATWAPVMTPTQTVHLGVSARYREIGGETPFTYSAAANTAYRAQNSAGGVLLSTGAVGKGDKTLALEGAWTRKSLSLQGEVAKIRVDRIDTSRSAANGGQDFDIVTGYAMASWFPTGETRPYSAAGQFSRIKVLHPLDKGGRGAYELAARYDFADLGDMKANTATALTNQPGLATAGTYKGLTAGLNWYPCSNVRFMANVTKAKINNRAIGALENDAKVTLLQTRMQIEF